MQKATTFGRDFVGSSLLRRITVFVFASILSVEIVLLVVSYFSERERLLKRVEDSVSEVSPLILSGTTDVAGIESLIVKQAVRSRYPLIGASVRRPGAADVLFGNTQNLTSPESLLTTRGTEFRYDSTDSTYDRLEIVIDDHGNETVQAWLRFDVQEMNRELRSYVGRILLIIAAICVFITISCVLAAHAILIKPLRKFRHVMISVRQDGLSHHAIPTEQLSRNDELGDIYRAFDRMRRELLVTSEAKNRLTTRFQDFADLGADCFFETDAKRNFKYASGDVYTLLGLQANQIIARNVATLADQGEFSLEDSNGVFDELEGSGSWEGRLLPVRFPAAEPNHQRRRKAVHIHAKKLFDQNGRFDGLRGVISDVTIASDLARDLTRQATHDGLTGLINRAEFERQLSKSLTRFLDHDEPACVLIMDLDRFKAVNDRSGHLAGDELLRQLSNLIRGQMRSEDAVARLGGDEFAVLLNNCESEFAAVVAENVRTMVEEFRYLWRGEQYSLGVSIGIAQLCSEFESTDDVVLAADSCCYKSKRLGRNQVTIYEPGDVAPPSQHAEAQWIDQITEAIEENRFELFGQRISPLQGELPDNEHSEVLLRMRTRDGELHSPEEFLPAADRYGLMGRIDRWVLNRVVPWVAQQGLSGGETGLFAVNLSTTSVSDIRFHKFLTELLGRNPNVASMICFDVTEIAIREDQPVAAAFLSDLRDMGCKIALDNFGSRFSSLDYLRQLPVDFVKIDCQSIRSISNSSNSSNSSNDRTLVQSISLVARDLNVLTVGKFVENEETLANLREIGIDYAQGLLISSPKPLPGIFPVDSVPPAGSVPFDAESASEA